MFTGPSYSGSTSVSKTDSLGPIPSGPACGENRSERSKRLYDISMRSRVTLFALLLVAGSLALPLIAQAGGIPFFGPIVPEEVNRCAAGWGMIITVFNNIISLLITLAIIFVAPLMIAYSGFLFVVNPVSASGKEQAKKILTNTIVGIVIALAGWMIVAALMSALYNANTKDSSGNAWGTWSQLITSGGAPICIPLSESLKQVKGQPPGVGVAGVSGNFSFANGIDAQIPTESGALRSLLSCMGTKLTTSAVITSISDSKITSGQQTFSSCRTNGQPSCAHAANSCHYGGRSCGDYSYAVDLSGDTADITNAAKVCGANFIGPENNHTHVSVGASCGCN